MTADNAIGTFAYAVNVNSAPTATGCFEATRKLNLGYKEAGHRMYGSIISLNLNNIKLWNENHISTEFRPINMSILYCIKCT
jgi:hypothetical protein